MRIGPLNLSNSAILAPLAGITDLPFRLLAKQSGCALVYSEMISANALVRESTKTIKMLDSSAEEKPLSVQIFGTEPAIMAEAARMVASSGADLLDINCGCAVKKIAKTGSGVALMRQPKTAEALFRTVRRTIDIPLTIKIRSGWDDSGRQAIEFARMAEACGVDAIAVHPRTATQGFRGQSDWSIIAAIKEAVSIPVIGNGDILCARDAVQMEAETGCDGIMIGRAAIGNPWIFSRYLALKTGQPEPNVDLAMRIETMIRYVRAMVDYWGESRACRMLRSRLGWFVKSLPHAGAFREATTSITAEDEALAVIDTFCATLEKRSMPQHEIGFTDGKDVAAAKVSGTTRQPTIAGLQDR
ncbi:MAG: tRNA dihydrouridine synthase DusB [Desulfobacterales bacterium]